MKSYENSKGLLVEVACGDLYILTSPFGFFEIERSGDIALWKMFGATFFHKVGDLSVLFGVNWNG